MKQQKAESKIQRLSLAGPDLKPREPARDPSRIPNVHGSGCAWRFLLPAALLLLALGARAQYSIDWQTIAGGGGTSTGGPYSLTGTIGQPDAGAMSGGNYSLQGGFWSMLAVSQAPGAPELSLSRSGTVLKIAWLKPATGWVLESSPALSGPGLNWTPVAQTYQDDGTDLYITLTAPPNAAFFRLHKP